MDKVPSRDGVHIFVLERRTASSGAQVLDVLLSLVLPGQNRTETV